MQKSSWSKPELVRFGTFREVTQKTVAKEIGPEDDFAVANIHTVGDEGGGS